jgi:hypothetical protein
MKHSEDLFDHAFRICENIVVPESKDDKSCFLQFTCSLFIVMPLFRMLPTIQLNDQSRIDANEIDYILSHGELPAKLPPFKLPIPQLHPRRRSASV